MDYGAYCYFYVNYIYYSEVISTSMYEYKFLIKVKIDEDRKNLLIEVANMLADVMGGNDNGVICDVLPDTGALSAVFKVVITTRNEVDEHKLELVKDVLRNHMADVLHCNINMVEVQLME